MFRFTIGKAELEEYKEIAAFMKKNGLEMSEKQLKEPEPGLIKMWKVTQGMKSQSGEIIAALILVNRNGNYVVSDIAVDWPMRKLGLGQMLMKKAEQEVVSLGSEELWLVAKVPEFYEKLGYARIPFDDAPKLFNCADCGERGVTCFPEVMKKRLE